MALEQLGKLRHKDIKFFQLKKKVSDSLFSASCSNLQASFHMVEFVGLNIQNPWNWEK